MIITVDGPSGSGKSSVSKALANRLGYLYFDSGALYRIIGYYFLKKDINPEEKESVLPRLGDICLGIQSESGDYRYFLNSSDITDLIRNPEVSHYASVLSQIKEVRDMVKQYSKKLSASGQDIIAEGRDAGTVLFPESPVKIYLTASVTERAKRRQKDYEGQNIEKDIKSIADEIEERDLRDSSREIDPLRPAEDSILIDTTYLGFEEVIKEIINIINEDNGGSLSKMDKYDNEDILKDEKTNSADINKDVGKLVPDEPDKKEGLSETNDTDNDDMSFAQMIEDYDTNIGNIKPKQIVKGRIIQITDSDVFIDVGFKSEGILPINEFSREIELKDENFKEGGEISVYVETMEDEQGNLKISKLRADKILLWDRLKKTYETGGSVRGKVIQHASNGGLVIDLGVLSGFVPAGHISIQKDETVPLGTIVETKILSLEPDKKKIILSRRHLLEDELRKNQKETLDKLYKGQLVNAVIKKLEPDHLIAEVDGITAFMHKKEMSWGRIEKPGDIFKKDQEIEAIIKSINKKKNSIRISYKDKTADPWTLVNTKYSVGQKIAGTIMSIKPYGFFVELEPGVEGLLHVSELSWDKVPKNPEQYAKTGDSLEVEIIDINTEEKRVSLSLKQCLENPWETFAETHPINSNISGEINNITDFGIFVKLNEDIDGLIHQSEISWDDNSPDINSLFKLGDTVEAKIIDINPSRKRVSLSIKQLKPNPVNILFDKLKAGDAVQGKVLQWEDFGCFVNISGSIDALLHISQIPNGKRDIKPKTGDIIEAEIIKLDKKTKKLSLSVWELFKKRFRENSMIEGKVVSTPEKGGAFIEVMPCVDAFIRQSELVNDSVHVGDSVKAVITKIDRDTKAVFASAKRIESKKEEEVYKDYMKKTQEEQKSFKNTVIPEDIAQILLKDTKKDS